MAELVPHIQLVASLAKAAFYIILVYRTLGTNGARKRP